MKRVVYLFLLVSLLAGALAGCAESIAERLEKKRNHESVYVGSSEFPECLVGVWEANYFGWVFKFESDGTIKKLRHMIVRHVNLDEDEGVVNMTGPEGGTALFVMGRCETDYHPRSRTLDVTVFLDSYEMVLANGVLKGRCEDYFTGQISQDCTTWNVEWRPYGYLEGATPPDPNIVEANPEPLVFTKLDFSKKD